MLRIYKFIYITQLINIYMWRFILKGSKGGFKPLRKN
jgi:hypothetical protein